MNQIYRLLFNAGLGAWQVAPETARARGKRSGAAVVLAGGLLSAALAAPARAQAPPPNPNQLPTGGQVVGGQAGIAQSGSVMTIDQGSRRAAIDWQGFDVGSQAQVQFKQPDAGSVTLNRVLGAGTSQIFGRVTANGQIFLTNADGVYFAPSASVNVGGLVATTHQIGLADFMAGTYRFTRSGATGSVVNQGQLAADLGGYIALLAPEVRNQGLVIAQAGTAVLAAGEAFTLNIPSANTLADIQVEPAAIKALVDNGSAVLAPDGVVILSARAADQLQGGVIRHSGRLEAGSLTRKGGVIRLEGDDITLAGGSSIDASGATGGGNVLVGGDWQGSGAMHQATKVTMEQGARIDASATHSGNGGKVVLWSDVHKADSVTVAQGSVLARGGANGGNGGQVETSGHGVDIDGFTANTLATGGGQTGLWLIDPYDYTINAAQASTIGTALNTSSVTVDTSTSNPSYGSNGGTTGSILLNSSITKTGAGTSTLTLQADKRVILNGNYSISSSGGPLNVVLWANADGNGQGGVHVPTLSTNGGHVWIGGGARANSTTWNGLTVGNGPATSYSSGNNNAVDAYGPITTNGGSVYLWAGGGTSGGAGLYFQRTYYANPSIDTGTGDLTLRTSTVNWTTPFNVTTTGAFTFWSPTGTMTTDTGTFGQGMDTGYFKFNVAPGSFTLGGSNNTQDVTLSDTYNPTLTVAGPISIYGRSINVNQSLTSTQAGADLLLKGYGNITLATGKSLVTNGGHITLWADQDANGGYIYVQDNATLDSRTSADRAASKTSTASGGGTITLGGGNTSTTLADGTVAPTGAAWQTTADVIGGISLGTSSGSGHNANIALYSGGGDISLNGKATAGASNASVGIWSFEGLNIDAGTNGNISLTGQGTVQAYSSGVYLGGWSRNKAATKLRTANGNITLNGTGSGGSAEAVGIYLVGQGGSGGAPAPTPVIIEATGSGSISLTGAGSISNFFLTGGTQILAASGAITLTGTTAGKTLTTAKYGNDALNVIGARAGSDVTSSTSNVTITDDSLNLTANNGLQVSTTGTLTVQPYGSNFTTTLNWPMTDFSVAPGITGLTLGKDGVAKTDTVNVNTAQNINGPIRIYGGSVAIGGALTAAGDIAVVASGTNSDLLINVPITENASGTSSLLLKSARNISLGANGNIVSNNGAMNTQVWADSDANGDGITQMASTTLATHGGSLKFGNGDTATVNGVAGVRVGGDVYFNGAGAQTISTGGGSFDLYGESILANTAGLSVNTSGGDANFWGVLNSGNLYTFVDKTGSAGSGSWTAARTEAKGSTGGGSAVGDSYLVTITSRLENSLAGLAAGYKGAWIGAYRANPTSSYAWTWADGPEGGQNFFNQNSSGGGGVAVAGKYTNFGSAEPNGTLSANESVGQFFGTAGQWNDLTPNTTYSNNQSSQYNVLGYVRETNLANSPLTINAGSGNVSINGGVGGNKALAPLNVTAAATMVNGNALNTSGAQSYSGTLTASNNGNLAIGATSVSAGSDITLTADTLTLNMPSIQSPGALTIQPYSTAGTVGLAGGAGTLQLAAGLFSGGSRVFQDGFSGITIGRSDGTGKTTVGGAFATTDDLVLRNASGGIALNGAVNVDSNNLTLNTAGSVSQTAALTANNLALLGGGNFTLTHTGNNVATLAGSTGSVSYRDADTLAIGTVGGTSGITAAGTVDIGTQGGNLSLAQNVKTTNATANAVVLNAGIATAAGTSTGGDIMIASGKTVSVGSGGTARLYTGSIAGSTTLADMSGLGSGSGRFRYGSDEATAAYTAPLATGLNAIYREQPSTTVTINDQAMTYGDAAPSWTYALVGGINGDTGSTITPASLAVGGALSTTGRYTAGTHAVSASLSGGQQVDGLGYRITGVNDGTLTVSPRTLTVGYTGVDRVYDGGTTATVITSDDRVAGDVLDIARSASFADRNAGNGKAVSVGGVGLSGADAANYSLASTTGSTTAGIGKATLALAGSTGVDKTYDGTARLPDGQAGYAAGSLAGVIGSDSVGVGGSAAYAGANVARDGSGNVTSQPLVQGTVALNGADAGNYQLHWTNGSGTITPAPLAVRANDDARFVTQADKAGYKGVSYSGFVNGEDETALAGTATITRTGGDTAAGTYANVLVASGLSSSNYDISYARGNYTIMGANQLLVLVGNVDNTYGSDTTYAVTSARYLASDGSTIVDLSGRTSASGNVITVDDGAGGVARFTLAPQDARTSTAGKLAAGSYQLGASGVSTSNAQNFSDTITVVGAHQVDTKGIGASATGVSKVYDGTTGMPGLALGLSALEAGDVVAVSGTGAFDSKHAGTGLGYTVSGLALSGSDAANYHLTGGGSLSGSDGSIAARPLTVDYTASNKPYDGNTGATAVASGDDRIGGDALTFSHTGANFADKNVGAGKTVTVSGITLGGTDAGNYTLASATATTTADITRLDSVTWTGGASGNWFDPANWAGGAVPDLSNVAHVVIPDGTTVHFDTSGAAAPADASGPVRIDSLGNAGTLVQNDGTLDVGTGGIALDALAQHGGTLTNAGATHLARYEQSGGSFSGTGDFQAGQFRQDGGTTRIDGDFTVTQDFSQGPSGSVGVGGNTTITDTSGGTTLGNLQTAGTTEVNSTGGAIAQAPGTAIVSGGEATFGASDGGAPADIALDGAGNDFKGPVNASGADIALHDANDLTLGRVTATGSLDLDSHGTLRLDERTHVGGDLGANSHGGDIAQAGTPGVGGTLRYVTEGGSVIGGDAASAAGSLLPRPAAAAAVPIAGAGAAGLAAGPFAESGDGMAVALADLASGAPPAGVTVTLVSAPTDTEPGVVVVRVPGADAASGFRFALPARITRAASQENPLRATMGDGAPLPAWLRLDAADGIFTAATVPAGALPARLAVSAGPDRWKVLVEPVRD